jgi:hypothetical protein
VQAVLSKELPQPPVDDQGELRKVALTEQQYLDASNALFWAREKAVQTLMLDLTP